VDLLEAGHRVASLCHGNKSGRQGEYWLALLVVWRVHLGGLLLAEF
jgi:hypothetical protein